MKRSFIFFLTAAAGVVVTSLVVWFVVNADLHLKKADAATSTILPFAAAAPESFKAAHAPNQATTRILALDRAKQLAFWTSVLRNRKQTCNVVGRTKYQGGSESGVDSWNIGCRDGNEYSVSIGPDAQVSEMGNPVCNGTAFARHAE